MNNELEQKLMSACSEDALVNTPASTASERKSLEYKRVKITRNGNSSLEIEYPCLGEIREFTRLQYFICICMNLGMVIRLLAGFMLFFETKSVNIHFCIDCVIYPLLFYCVLYYCKSIRSAKLNVRITPDGYRRVINDTTWRSFFQTLFLPWHFNNFENAEYVKPGTENLQFNWSPSCKERMKSQAIGDLHIDTELCKQSYCLSKWDFEIKESFWIYDEVNQFLKEANQKNK